MFKLLNKEDNNYEYLVYDLETEYLNGFRRVLYSELKNYCFDYKNTVIIKNNTNINNEIITHRLSLIPLNITENLKFFLHKKNDTNEIMNIYSNDLQCEKSDIQIDNNILLLKLKPNEEINLITNTKISNGNEHISFRPFSVCFFKIMKGIYIKKGINYTHLKDKINYYDYSIDLFPKIDGYDLIGYTNEIRDYCDPLKKLFDTNDYIIKELEYHNKYVYYFYIELFYKNDDIINISKELLIKNLENFINLEKEYEFKNNKSIINIQNGNYHTLNILSKFIRNEKNIYCVYNKKHPLKDEILLEYEKNDSDYSFLYSIINEIKYKINKIISL